MTGVARILNNLTFRSRAKHTLTNVLQVLPDSLAYRVRGRVERLVYNLTPEVHALPPIFHYWANTYLRPQFEQLGFHSPDDFLYRQIAATLKQCAPRKAVMLSIGCGRCEPELALSTRLRAAGQVNFRFVCNDLNPAMLKAARKQAADKGVAEHFEFLACDVSVLNTNQRFDVVLAYQCLHHIVALESVFDTIHRVLDDDGIFLTVDVMGRNGHQLWPEALTEATEYWERLPREYRFDRATGRQMDEFVNYDHSNVAFEGIRAQDVLPLLVERFHFNLFAGYACIVLPFVDRRFGWNFDPQREFDKAFIDDVAQRDQALLAEGVLKPTQMLACMGKRQVHQPIAMGGLTALAAVRPVDRRPLAS